MYKKILHFRDKTGRSMALLGIVVLSIIYLLTPGSTVIAQNYGGGSTGVGAPSSAGTSTNTDTGPAGAGTGYSGTQATPPSSLPSGGDSGGADQNGTATPTTEEACIAQGWEWTNDNGNALSYYCKDPAAAGRDRTANCRGFAIAWLVCGAINVMADLGDYLIQQFIVPFLMTSPLKITEPNDPTFKVWSSFRIVANIILVAALLFVIFGNAFGDGFAQAYLAKKSLPRIFIAAILINTSIYIAAGMIDITNVIGKGIGQMMMAPFAAQGAFLFNLGFGATTTFTLSMIGGAIFLYFVPAVIPMFLLFVLLPALVAMVAVFVTLVVRQGLLLFLVLISPIAFALFALPNTAKYFGKWWDTFLKTLMVYPIVMIVIATSNILAVLVNDNAVASSAPPGSEMIKDLISIFLMLAPLFLIPFAFKMAGGITGKIYGMTSGMGKKGVEAFKGNPRDPDSRQSRIRRNFRSGTVQARAGAINSLDKGTRSKRGWIKYPAMAATRALNYGNLQQRRGVINQESDAVTAAMLEGREAMVRAFFAKEQLETETITDKFGNTQELKKGHFYSYYKNESGRHDEYSPTDVQGARKIARSDPSMLQSFAKVEFGKAQNNGTVREFKDTMLEKMNDYGYTPEQADSVWYQVKYAHKGNRLEEKHTKVTGEKGNLRFTGVDHSAFSNELVDSAKSYDFAGFRSSTANAAWTGFQEAQARVQAAGANASAADQQIVKNYKQLADHMGLALSQGNLGSPEAHEAWSNFVNNVSGASGGRHRATP